MIPGTTSKLSTSVVASANKIHAKTDIVHITGGGDIQWIVPYYGGFAGILFLNPIVTPINLIAGGNINTVMTLNRTHCFLWLPRYQQWTVVGYDL